MCGIAGFISSKYSENQMSEMASQMAAAIRHRGPDDSGVWFEAASGIALSHRRLSVVDLSAEGHQPMLSACGRYVIAFNGEIYNYQQIRKDLEKCGAAPPWRGHSDTEVVLAAISHWGLEAALQRFVGMFAFALWDRNKRLLQLARDRLGEKPLYYGAVNHVFLFGSELKALRAHPAWQGQIDRDALALYTRHNYIPCPYSIYKGIYKLPPGTFLRVETSPSLSITSHVYWSAKQVAEAGSYNTFTGTETEALENLESLLKASIKQQMVADVPLGAFLSGGIDSSTVVALMQAQSARPIKTFTIGFHEMGYDEAGHAKNVAQHLGTDHTELYVTSQEAMAVIPQLPTLYDEPFSDSSQIPTFLVARLARQHVTVSLSGDGGDELFGGYNRYFWGQDTWKKIGWMPNRARKIIAKALTAFSPRHWEVFFAKIAVLLPSRFQHHVLGDKIHKMAEIISAKSPEELYLGLVSHWKSPSSLVLGTTEYPTVVTDSNQWAVLSNFIQHMMYLDTVSYLPDDILVKVDRASMGVSLESRVPFLDHRIVEFSWTLPMTMKIKNQQGKWLLRQLLDKYVPKKLIERPKRGFGVPMDSWLRGPLRDWAESLLDEKRLGAEGFFNPVLIREKWTEHLSGRRNWQFYLWDILMFQSWWEHWKS